MMQPTTFPTEATTDAVGRLSFTDHIRLCEAEERARRQPKHVSAEIERAAIVAADAPRFERPWASNREDVS